MRTKVMEADEFDAPIAPSFPTQIRSSGFANPQPTLDDQEGTELQ